MQPVDPCNPEAPVVRYDAQGRRLCTAHSVRTGEPCNSPAMNGMKICRMHGGASPQAQLGARLRMLELVDPAITALAAELDNPNAEIRLKAANSILDRAGHGRGTKIESSEAKQILIERLLAIRAQHAGVEPDEATRSEYVIEGTVIEPE